MTIQRSSWLAATLLAPSLTSAHHGRSDLGRSVPIYLGGCIADELRR